MRRVLRLARNKLEQPETSQGRKSAEKATNWPIGDRSGDGNRKMEEKESKNQLVVEVINEQVQNLE